MISAKIYALDLRPSNVSVILVNWNGWKESIDCLDSLLGMRDRCGPIFVIDNASSDESIENMARWCELPYRPEGARDLEGVFRLSAQPRTIRFCVLNAPADFRPDVEGRSEVVLVRSGGNLGFAGGNNVGVRLATQLNCAGYWLLNTDTVVHHLALAALVARARSNPGVGMVGSTLLYHSAPNLVQGMGGGRLDRKRMLTMHLGIGSMRKHVPTDPRALEREMDYVIGASMLVSREFVDQVGLMQEDYFLYYEEIDWAVRGAAKFDLAYAPQSIVFHKVGATSAATASAFSLRLLYRNRLRFIGRFFPERRFFALGYATVEIARHLGRGRWAHAKFQAAAVLDSRKLFAGDR